MNKIFSSLLMFIIVLGVLLIVVFVFPIPRFGYFSTAPIISLTGDSTVYVEYEGDYSEQRATFKDNRDDSGIAITGGDTVDSNALGNYTITYNITDRDGNIALEETRTVIVQDTTIPVISLTGDSTIYLEYQGTYLEQGATSSDNYDTSGIAIVGGDIVDSSILGIYLITYNSTDTSGNEALEVTRTVIVEDTTVPVISLTGDSTVYVEYEEVYLELGATFSDNYDASGDAIIGEEIVDISVLGTYTITYNAIDSNGNIALVVTRTIIVQDTTVPVITLTGDSLVYLEYQETYLEQGATFTDNYDPSGDAIIGGDTVDSSVLGTYIIRYTYIGSSGNEALEVTRTVIVEDTTVPVITITGDSTVYIVYQGVYTELGATFSDNYDASGDAIIVSNTIDTSIRGIFYVTYSYTDSSGNRAASKQRKVVVGDIIAPVVGNLPTTYTIDRGDSEDLITAVSVIAVDDVDGNLYYDIVTNYPDTTYLQPGSYTATFSATDLSGNTGTASMTLVVTDDSSNIAIDIANLVIFIRFSDETTYSSPMNYADIEDMFNDNNMSLQDYYLEVSHNDYKLFTYFTNDSIVFYTDNHPRGYYQTYDSVSNTIGYETEDEEYDREYALLKSAIDYIENNNLIDTSVDLDMNNDGDIDNITFLVSNEVEEWNDLLWPHRYSMWESVDIYGSYNIGVPQINGDYAWDYTFQLLGETNLVSSYFDLGTLAHELFHVIGAPDLYHYYSDTEISPVGSWDIMNITNSIPNHMLMFMKEEYGNWEQDIIEVTASGEYSFNVNTAIEDNGIFIDLGYSNEFLYMEYRHDSGDYESSIYDTGIIFYRVDQDFEGNREGMYDELGKSVDEVYLFRSDGTFDSSYLLTDRYIVEDDGNPNNGVMNHSTFTSIGENTSIPFFYSDGTEIAITISLVSMNQDTVVVTMDIN